MNQAKKFAKVQPKDGDKVLHCGHHGQHPYHFFAAGDGTEALPVTFKRPDGTLAVATWMVLCKRCLITHGANPWKAAVADGTFVSDGPEITKDFQ
jgi:hypothetical protein